MIINHLQFFHDAVKELTGSLIIEDALMKCLKYFQGIIPCDTLSITLWEPGLSSLRQVAIATDKDKLRIDNMIHVNDIQKSFITWPYESNVIFFNDFHKNPVCSTVHAELDKLFNIGDSSHMIMRVDIEDQRICDVNLTAKGFDRYTQDHAKLLSLLSCPFGIVVSNAQRYWTLMEEYGKLNENKMKLEKELIVKCGCEIIGHSLPLRNAITKATQVASTTSPVLLLGETGTGKDMFASFIQKQSSRSVNPFVTVNCGAIPESLIDSDLFGHEKGAFTGALQQHKGRFERAHTGTIFLDEVGELTPSAQVKLLRVLQSGDFERVGGHTLINVDVRVIAATNRNLALMVKEGTFREDLFYRLNVFPIILPSLKERHEDIALLTDYFIKKISKKFNIAPPKLEIGELNKLKAYTWPGNIRELANIVEQSLICHTKGDLIITGLPTSTEPLATDYYPTTVCTLDEANINCIKAALDKTNGRISGPNGAAKLLGVKSTTLRSKMQKLCIS
ncbi:sigma-54 interaction domain-containing protein [Seleniivibrio woodruffii]|uniref:Regulatory Fis family protein n=1 Tax=Seleniivibrio woodruffii TaxID=1078050 RepID=A0A4R1K3J1_9BACT|nr:sigma 54-interacting transcriptional regulator [Seleniivibrio woodruffii]TCK58470.1 regulatory Fis family protein [Seleniivibrio woodruffii]TVZ36843.1 regulatory Fis family protein [Seleniivibrio woodruffii]